ncbi:MAG TPA: hypothetical protein VGW14_06600 [Thermoleophilaceae bacterium]|nr:hypothetical protein [Thermoleophilaceae bacterium]
MPLRMLRYADLAVLAAALPVFVAAELPMFAWAGVTVAWLLQRSVHAFLLGRAEASGNPRAAVGLMSVSILGRIWFIALAVLGIGLIDDDAGLPAAILTGVTFQVWFTALFVGRGIEGGRA